MSNGAQMTIEIGFKRKPDGSLASFQWTTGSEVARARAPFIRRGIFIRPAYNCGLHGTNCKHEPCGDHGRSSEKRFYVVGDAREALEISVLDCRGRDCSCKGVNFNTSGMGFHSPATCNEDKIRDGQVGTHCEYIEAPCFIDDAGFIAADEFYEEHGSQTSFKQSEKFWLALEMEFFEWRDHHAKRVREVTVKQCPACSGKGLVLR